MTIITCQNHLYSKPNNHFITTCWRVNKGKKVAKNHEKSIGKVKKRKHEWQGGRTILYHQKTALIFHVKRDDIRTRLRLRPVTENFNPVRNMIYLFLTDNAGMAGVRPCLGWPTRKKRGNGGHADKQLVRDSSAATDSDRRRRFVALHRGSRDPFEKCFIFFLKKQQRSLGSSWVEYQSIAKFKLRYHD